ncbi:MAG TPA: hypothetical protein VLF68_04235 [Candidatus Saccharimonadales bacterium]|nr:hypothetical protein [Candidatus Saccharimonadales bacterium]
MKEQRIGLISDTILEVHGRRHPIRFGDYMTNDKGISMRAFAFDDEMKNVANGGETVLQPYVASVPMFITGYVVRQEVPISGKGSFLAVDPRGQFQQYDFDAEDKKYMVEYGKDWLVTWIAGDRGMIYLSLTQPPSGMESFQIVRPGTTNIGERKIPLEFWDAYADSTYDPVEGVLKQARTEVDYKYELNSVIHLSPVNFRRLQDKLDFQATLEKSISDTQEISRDMLKLLELPGYAKAIVLAASENRTFSTLKDLMDLYKYSKSQYFEVMRAVCASLESESPDFDSTMEKEKILLTHAQLRIWTN